VAFRISWVLLLGVASCSGPSEALPAGWVPVAAPDLGEVVARVGEVPIFAKQVLAEAARSGKTPRAALAALVDGDLVAEAARGRGHRMPLTDDPDVKSAMVERLLERELEPSLQVSAIPDPALRPLYERAREAFVHPRLVEVGVLAVYTGAAMKQAPRQERATTAKALAAFVAKHPPRTLDDFAAIARDSQWSQRHVVYNRLWQGADRPLSKTVGTEIAKLVAPEQTTSLLSDETGYFIARYIGERPAENVSYGQARPKLAAAYFERWRQEQFLDFTAKLLAKHTVAIHFDRIVPDEQGR
jgi:hypothetical protein